MNKETAHDSIILIGMPAAGKSTLGVILAKELGMDFIDTDLLIQVKAGKTLQQIVDEQDYMALREIEEQVLLELAPGNHVISTGGSAVYSKTAMEKLKGMGTVVYLDTPLPVLEKRLSNFATRGIARHPDQSMADLFTERTSLYKRYADITVDCKSECLDTVLQLALDALKAHQSNASA
jgi:shikimate kinase